MRIGIGCEGTTADAVVESVRRAKEAGFTSGWFPNIFGFDGMTACALAVAYQFHSSRSCDLR